MIRRFLFGRLTMGAAIGLMLLSVAFLAEEVVQLPLASANADSQFGGLYNPGGLYQIKVEQYRRYGQEKAAIEANTDSLMNPERSIRDIRFRPQADGSAKDILITVSPVGGSPWYTMAAPDGRSYTMSDNRNGQSTGLQVVPQGIGAPSSSRIDWFQKLSREGWTTMSSSTGSAVLQLARGLQPDEEKALLWRARDTSLTPLASRL